MSIHAKITPNATEKKKNTIKYNGSITLYIFFSPDKNFSIINIGQTIKKYDKKDVAKAIKK